MRATWKAVGSSMDRPAGLLPLRAPLRGAGGHALAKAWEREPVSVMSCKVSQLRRGCPPVPQIGPLNFQEISLLPSGHSWGPARLPCLPTTSRSEILPPWGHPRSGPAQRPGDTG